MTESVAYLWNGALPLDTQTQKKQTWALVNGTADRKQYSQREMLQYKYLLSVEGNDVASNLKWALASHSVVVMPHPTKETWLMVGLLVPYTHYVPISVDTLESVYEWLVRNDDACAQIVRNANRWVDDILENFTTPIRGMFDAARYVNA